MSKLLGHTTFRQRVWDYIAYTLISLVVVAALIVAALKGVSELLIMDWYGLALFTACVFGQFILINKHLWARRSFWVLCAITFAAHMLLCGWLFYTEGEVPGKQWLALALVEIVVLVGLGRFMFGPRPTRPK